ncbi:MAG: hypothetical protein K2M56_07275 [Muribaculaceae bacterium]|nr:hypothetical protein [Muribaculaceae bacterium]
MPLNSKIYLFFFIFLSSLLIAPDASAKRDAAVEENIILLQRLDSLIAHRDKLIERKEERIKKLKADYLRAPNLNRRLESARKLYKEYSVYNSDSALYYAHKATELAGRSSDSNPDLLASCKLDEIFIYTTQGFGEEALRRLESINTAELSNEMKIEYFQVGQYIYSTQALFNTNGKLSDPYIGKSNAFRDSLVRLDPHGADNAAWAPIALQVEKDSSIYTPPVRAVERLKQIVDSASEPNRDNAINAYWLSRHYKLIGDDVNMIRYLTKAAIYDTEIENREIAALTELAQWLYHHNDLDRAYTYLIYSSDQANAYHNRARMLNVSALLPTIRDAYREALKKSDDKLRFFLWILVALSIVLIGLVIFIVFKNRSLHRTRLALSKSNSKLKETVADRDHAISALEESNEALEKSNSALETTNIALEKSNSALSNANSELSKDAKVKEGLVIMSYRLASDHINALDEYRKKLLRKYKMKQMVELGAELNDQELIKDPYKNFYAALDHTMLTLYPDFISEYNQTVPEDQRFDPAPFLKSRNLNTRLRIFALRRLGVEKSADIAGILNISIRTVYNNR